MEVIKNITEKGNKFYLIEVLYIKGNKTFYPYFSGYYASGMPIELKEGVDEDSPILTYQDIKVAYDEYEALSLLMITEDNNDDNRKLAEEMVNEKIKAALVNEIEKFIKEEEEMEKMISENKNGFGWYGNMDEMNRRDGFLSNGKDKDEEFYNYYEDGNTISLRFVNIELPTGETETIITNIGYEGLYSEDINKIYQYSWGIETSYHDLKESMQLKIISLLYPHK